eukprot:8569767-Heterocapsa_arctica.AAC.1
MNEIVRIASAETDCRSHSTTLPLFFQASERRRNSRGKSYALRWLRRLFPASRWHGRSRRAEGQPPI